MHSFFRSDSVLVPDDQKSGTKTILEGGGNNSNKQELCGQYVYHLMPKVNLTTGIITGLTSLLT